MTPQELDNKKKRYALLQLSNRILSQFSFKRLNTWRDVYVLEGRPDAAMPDNKDKSFTFSELKQHLADLKQQLETKLAAPTGPVIRDVSKSSAIVPTPVVVVKPPEPIAPIQQLAADENYGLVASPNEKCFFYWFQKKAIAEALHGILGK